MRIGPQIGPRIGAQIGARIGMAPPAAVAEITFVGASDATFTIPDDGVEFSVSTPIGVATGDTMLIFVATIDGASTPTSLPSGWAQIAELHSDNETVLFVFRRRATGSEPATHTILPAPGNGITRVGAALVAYRGLDTAAALVASAITDCDANGLPTTNFPCPGVMLTGVSDLFVGIVWVSDAAPAVTAASGGTERIDVSQISNVSDPVPRRIEVFDLRPGVVGSVGAKTATITAPHVGIAATLLLKAA